MSQKSLRANFLALGSIQGMNYLVSFMTLPYLARILGVEVFGKYSLVQIMMGYLMILTEWGFKWSGTRRIASMRHDLKEVSRTFMAIWCAQLMLGAIVALGLIVTVRSLQVLGGDWVLYLFGFTMVIGNLLMPSWLFEGLEYMREIAIFDFIGRVVPLPFLFIFVKKPDDVALALGIIGCGQIVSGALSMIWIHTNKVVVWESPKLCLIYEALREGGGFFITKVSTNAYNFLTPIILGSISGAVAVGYFNLANKLRMVGQSLLLPVSQTLFPRMSHLYTHDREAANTLIWRSSALVVLIALPVCMVMLLNSTILVVALGGREFIPAAAIVKWLSFIPLFFAFTNVFGVQVMIPNSMGKIFNVIVGLVAIGSMMLIKPFILMNGPVGAAMLMFFTELLITLMLGIYVLKTGLLKIPTIVNPAKS